MKPLIIYRAGHLDGMTAAYVAARALSETDSIDGAEFRAVNYDDPIPDLTDRVVYIVGFNYLPADLLPKVATSIDTTVIDSSLTTIKKWGGIVRPLNLYLISNVRHSGAGLAWVFFNNSKPMPTYVSLAQDHDLFKFELEDTKPFTK